MRHLAPLVFLAVLTLVGTGRAQQVDSAEAHLIRRIIETTDMGNQMLLSIEANVPAQREANPAIPSVFWDRFLERARARNGELLDEMIPIYADIFSPKELEQLLQFWQSDIGRRFVQLQPQLTQRIMTVAQEWGGRLGLEIAGELEEEGVLTKP